ncbi:putative membrane protein [Candidatus Nanobsidianus stetteri]|uniref:Putative membrane protein n=1 Tax=Nanobsidianus stetteri TaxID=1294122 RepID=R1FTW0_NANST|nr:putative membrane protein [Candidatus Nanobsidianus stetteri]
MDLSSFIYNLFSEYGIFTFVAPFLLVFSLLYGSLRKTGLFGKDNPNKEKLYAIISMVISFYYLYNISDVIFTSNFISFFFFEVLVIFFILMIIALMAGISEPYKGDEEFERYKQYSHNVIVGFITLTVLFAFLYASSTDFNGFGSTAQNIIIEIFLTLIYTGLLPFLIIIGFVIAAIYWVYHQEERPKKKRKVKYYIYGPMEALYELPEHTKR